MTANATFPYWTGTVSFHWQTFMKHHDCRTRNLLSKAFDYDRLHKCFVTNFKSLQSLFLKQEYLRTALYYLVSYSQCILLLCWNLRWDIMINQHFKQRRVEELLTLSNLCEIHICCFLLYLFFRKSLLQSTFLFPGLLQARNYLRVTDHSVGDSCNKFYCLAGDLRECRSSERHSRSHTC